MAQHNMFNVCTGALQIESNHVCLRAGSVVTRVSGQILIGERTESTLPAVEVGIGLLVGRLFILLVK